jgi:hypothetical protein
MLPELVGAANKTKQRTGHLADCDFHDKWRAIFHEICRDRFVPARYWLRDDLGHRSLRQISWKKRRQIIWKLTKIIQLAPHDYPS